MRKTPRMKDERIIESSGNVFADLGFDEAEAELLAMRVRLMKELRARLAKTGKTQAQLARELKVTQPRVSALMRGAHKDFSMDMVLVLARRAGMRPQVKLVA